MSNIYQSLTDLIGRTPLLRLKNFEAENGVEAELVAKLEYFNPAGSVKDRIAKAMIDDAEKKGILKPDSVIIEPTSGNTGSRACISRVRTGLSDNPDHARDHEH